VSDPFPHPALGIDYGVARIGIAASDPVGIMAHPVETIHWQKTDPFTRIATLIAQRGIKTIVIGLPCHLDGSEGESAQKVRHFVKQLQAQHPQLPIHLIDEAYTTVTAAAKLHEAGKNAKRQKALIDQASAVEILQSWMERHAS
jgi:putative Holliday junction resolvase